MYSFYMMLLIDIILANPAVPSSSCKMDSDCSDPTNACVQISGFRCSCKPRSFNIPLCTSAHIRAPVIQQPMPKLKQEELRDFRPPKHSYDERSDRAKKNNRKLIAGDALVFATIIGPMIIMICCLACCAGIVFLGYVLISRRRRRREIYE